MGEETRYGRKTLLVISETKTQFFANSVTIGATALNLRTLAHMRYLVAVAVHVIVIEVNFAHFTCK